MNQYENRVEGVFSQELLENLGATPQQAQALRGRPFKSQPLWVKKKFKKFRENSQNYKKQGLKALRHAVGR